MPRIGAGQLRADIDIGDVSVLDVQDISDALKVDASERACIDIEKIANVTPQLDDTDKLAVSVYGKNAAAGDVQPKLTPQGRTALAMQQMSGVSENIDLMMGLKDENDTSRQVWVGALSYLWEGSKFQYNRNNLYVQLAASAARTAVLTTADLVNYNHTGIVLIVDVTARAGATTLYAKMQVKAVTGQTYFDVWSVAAAINTADGTFVYLFYPTEISATALYTENVNMAVPRTIRFVFTPNNSDSVTYSADLYYLL